MFRRRLDVELVSRGLVSSRQEAARAVAAKVVLVNGSVAEKASHLVAPADSLVISNPVSRFVSRGGEKLDVALSSLGIDVRGKRVADVGASTGGFTDCVLQRGAAYVLAVDVGHGQLDAKLRRDPRVKLLERTNVRYLSKEKLGEASFDVVLADLSFISLTKVIPVLVQVFADRGSELLLLVKPQFESGRKEVSKGRGVILEDTVRQTAVQTVSRAMMDNGVAVKEVIQSPLKGARGNVEFFLYGVVEF